MVLHEFVCLEPGGDKTVATTRKFVKLLEDTLVCRSEVLQNAVDASSGADGPVVLVLPSRDGRRNGTCFFSAWKKLLTENKTEWNQTLKRFSLPLLLSGLKVRDLRKLTVVQLLSCLTCAESQERTSSDFLVDEEALDSFLHELVDRMLTMSCANKLYNLRSRTAPPPEQNPTLFKPAQVSDSAVAAHMTRKKQNGQILQKLPSHLVHRLLHTYKVHALSFIKLFPNCYHALILEACMLNLKSSSLHFGKHTYGEWRDFTVEHRAFTMEAAATLSPRFTIKALKIYGSWLLETMSFVVGNAVNNLFCSLPSLQRLHLYAFPAHTPEKLPQAIRHLTSLTELIIEEPICPLTHRHINAVLNACSSLQLLRKVQLPYYLRGSAGATEVCEIVSNLQQIESLSMHGCFRNMSLDILSAAESQSQAFFDAPQAVAQCLGKLSNLKQLELSQCFEGQDLEDVMLAIGGMKQLTFLSLANVESCTKRTTMHFAGIFAFTVIRRAPCGGIVPMLEQLSGLMDLNLAGAFLPSDHLQTASAIANMTCLTALCLSSLEVEPEFWHAFATRSTTLTRLESLDVSKVDSIESATMIKLAYSMASMQNLTDIHMTGTEVGDAAAAVFHALRCIGGLRLLAMGQCNICHDQKGWLAATQELSALSALTSLHTLVLAYNDFGLSGARAIAQALTGMKQLEYALVYPSDVGGEEGMSIIEEAVVATFGRERATSVLLGDPHRACSMWIAGLH